MKIIAILLIGLFASTAFAEERCEFKDPNILLERLTKTHPSVLEDKLRTQAAQLLVGISKQRPNPNLEAEMLFGNPNSQFAADTFFSLQHTIELGGKRKARIKSAEAQIEASELQQRKTREEVIVGAAVQLYRLRQIDELSKLFKESIDAFGKIRKRLARLPSRSPEQQVEMDTLDLASSAYEFAFVENESEKEFIEKHLAFFSGCSIPPGSLVFPTSPNLPSELNQYSDVNQSIDILLAKKALKIAHARLDQEKTKKTPNLGIGPAVGYGRSQGMDSVLIGAALSMPIPLLNTNRGKRDYEDANIRTAALEVENALKEAQLDLGIWKDRYHRFYRSLRSSNPSELIEKKHKRIESLFSRGVVSTALVIESHRQLIEFSEGQFSFELGAIEALWNIYRLTGNLEGARLQ